MITPSGVVAVTSRTSGTVSGSTTNEWYRVATKGSGSPLNRLRPSWWTDEVLPCMRVGADTTRPP